MPARSIPSCAPKSATCPVKNPRVIEPQRPGRAGQSHFARIGRLDFQDHARDDGGRRVALLLDHQRIEDDEMAGVVIAGVEIRCRVVADHIDFRHRLAAAIDRQYAGSGGM
jgi:hypothetical protein